MPTDKPQLHDRKRPCGPVQTRDESATKGGNRDRSRQVQLSPRAGIGTGPIVTSWTRPGLLCPVCACEQNSSSANPSPPTWLAAMIERAAADPVTRLAGSLDSATPDLASNHDDYLAAHA